MRSRDLSLLAGLAIAGLLGAFWFLALSPKREEAGELQDRIEQLQASVSEQEQLAAAAEQARDQFDGNYQRLVVLGKAVPQDEDTASLFVQLERVAERSSVDFRAIRLEQGAGGGPAPPPPSNDDGLDGGDGDSEGGAETPPPQPVAATESAAAGLPLGATVGAAGLPVMPYTVDIKGTFFEVADFLDGIDALIRPRGERPRVQGRLLTIDAFSMSPDGNEGFPKLETTLSLTSFIAPPEHGLTAGASPAGPSPAVPTPAASGGTP